MTKEQAAAAIAEILKPFRVEGRDQSERDQPLTDILGMVLRDKGIDVQCLGMCPHCFMVFQLWTAIMDSTPDESETDSDEGQENSPAPTTEASEHRHVMFEGAPFQVTITSPLRITETK